MTAELTTTREHSARLGILALFTAALALAVAALPPISQPAEYHAFADTRSFFGVRNFFDVASNLGFLAVGLLGIAWLARDRDVFAAGAERWPWALLFCALVLTAFGSAYYHFAPDNSRLVWDRLPIAAGLMAVVAAMIAERVAARLGLFLLPLLIVVGIASVIYWNLTDDLRFYLFVQTYPLAAILLIALLYPPRYTRTHDLFAVFGLYFAAKLCEFYDKEIFALGKLISGHTLKHLLAALALYVLLRMLQKRTPLISAPLKSRPIHRGSA